MSVDTGGTFWNQAIETNDCSQSEISSHAIPREPGSQTRTMQNNKPRYLVDVAAELAKTMLTKDVVDGRQPSMGVASQMMTGILIGYDAATSMQRFQVAHSMIDVVDQLVVTELSKLVMSEVHSRITWKQAAALVGVPDSTLYSRYRDRVHYPKA